jgi:predicted amidohydrolase YtcJ
MVVNGHVYTGDARDTSAEAVAIQGNKIVRIGTNKEIQRLRRPQTVVIDAKGGTVLPGFIEVNATDLIEPFGPSPTRAEQIGMLRRATVEAHRLGITSVQVAATLPQELEHYDELRREGELSLRVYGAINVDTELTPEQIDALDDFREQYPDDPLFKAGAVVIHVDAASSRPNVSREALERAVRELDKRGWQISIHADGDAAMEMALHAYTAAFEANPAPARGRRHLIDYQGVGPADVKAFEKIGVRQYISPLARATLQQTIDAYTREAAWLSFDEQRKGLLARDMLADIVIFSADLFATPAGSLGDAEVSVTIFDGKVVYQRTSETN